MERKFYLTTITYASSQPILTYILSQSSFPPSSIPTVQIHCNIHYPRLRIIHAMIIHAE
jgi:hypothetical protein